jgi:hypothetical protein
MILLLNIPFSFTWKRDEHKIIMNNHFSNHLQSYFQNFNSFLKIRLTYSHEHFCSLYLILPDGLDVNFHVYKFWVNEHQTLHTQHFHNYETYFLKYIGATGWMNEKQGFDSWHGQEILLFFIAPRPALGLIQPSIQWGPGVFTRE